MNNELTKNEFTEIISELQNASTYQKELELFFLKIQPLNQSFPI